MNKQEKYGLDKHLVRFSTEKECYDYLFSVKWGTKPKCSSCGNNHMNYYISTRKTYKCSQCYKQFSLIQGTIFEKSRIPLTKWFIAIYFFTTNKRGISSVQLSKWIGVTQRTAWFMLHRLREALKEENNIILSGIVEVDETFIGPDIRRDTRLQKLRRLHNEEQDRIHGYGVKKRRTIEGYRVRGRKKGDTPEMLEQRKKEKEEHLKKYGKRKQFERVTVVLGMLERGGRLVMKRLGHSSNTVNREAIFPHLKRHIHRDSTLFTDQHIVYIEAKDMFKWHYSVNHEVGYVVDGIHTNGIENAWKHLKKLLDATYFHVSNRHFDRYLDEYTYRWNKQNESDKVLFESFIPFVINKRLSFNGLKQEEIRLAA